VTLRQHRDAALPGVATIIISAGGGGEGGGSVARQASEKAAAATDEGRPYTRVPLTPCLKHTQGSFVKETV